MTDRIGYIDIFRGIAIILVVIGHLEILLALYKYIFSFHMFAFFFISGMLEHSHKCGTLFAEAKKNTVVLLIQYLFFAFMWDTVNLVSTFYLTGYVDLGLTAILKNIATVLLCGCIESNASIGTGMVFGGVICYEIHLLFYVCVGKK